jgi:hypothetical protein
MFCANFKIQKPTVLILAAGSLLAWTFASHGQIDTAVKINEVFPRATASCPEWIELFNTGNTTINLRGWYMGHKGDSSLVSAGDVMVRPGGFCVVTRDTTQLSAAFPAAGLAIQPAHWHALDNYHDTLMLWDAGGIVCDSAGWDYRWFSPTGSAWVNQSLSRVSVRVSGFDRTAWVLSANPTPGDSNPEVAWRAAASVSLDIGPIPFTPNNDGRDDYLSIKLMLPAGATGSIAIYGFDGRKYYEVAPVVSPEILWNGKTSNGSTVPNGPFFVVAQTSGNNGSKSVIRKKGVLWR